MKTSAIFLLGFLGLAFTAGLFLSSRDDSRDAVEDTAISWVSFDEGMRLAREQEKKILIDVFTDWCGWCKRMDADVYSDHAVADALNASFVPVKLNAESDRVLSFGDIRLTEAEFARSAGVNSYPTTMFLEPDGSLITLVPGYIPREKFVPILLYVGEDHFHTLSFQEYLSRSPLGK